MGQVYVKASRRAKAYTRSVIKTYAKASAATNKAYYGH